MVLTPEDVRNKRFTVTRFRPGYDEEEVDSFLDEVEAELRRLLAERETLAGGPSTAPLTREPLTATSPSEDATATMVARPRPSEPPSPAPPPASPEPLAAAAAEPAAAEPALAPSAGGGDVGHEAALRTLLLAQRTADEAVAEARREAEEILTSARTRAEELDRQSREDHAQLLAALTRERESLERSVQRLRSFEHDYRERLRVHLQERLRELDAQPALAPDGAEAAVEEEESWMAPAPAGPGLAPAGPGPAPAGPGALPRRSPGVSPFRPAGFGGGLAEAEPAQPRDAGGDVDDDPRPSG